MSPLAIVAIVAMSLYSLYRQSIRTPVDGGSRFKLASIYAAVGLLMGGLHQPETRTAWIGLAGSLMLSAIVGILRGQKTHLSTEGGRVYSQGTPATIGLFLALALSKFAMGTYAYLHGRSSHGGFGEVLLMIALMAALQAELVWRRALGMLAIR